MRVSEGILAVLFTSLRGEPWKREDAAMETAREEGGCFHSSPPTPERGRKGLRLVLQPADPVRRVFSSGKRRAGLVKAEKAKLGKGRKDGETQGFAFPPPPILQLLLPLSVSLGAG